MSGNRYVWGIVIAAGLALIMFYSFTDKGVTGKIALPGHPTSLQHDNEGQPEARVTNKSATWIEMVSIKPDNPTTLDMLNAEVRLYPSAPAMISFSYEWFVNGKLLKQHTVGILSKGVHKKNNIVTVKVTPVSGDATGHQYMSKPIMIGNAPPDLFLSDAVTVKDGVFELKLNGEDPDGDNLVYALEEPGIQGMIIDNNTGKITWKPALTARGVFRFRASVTDSSGSHTAKTFQFNLEPK